MGFPVTIGTQQFDNPPALASAVRSDALGGGGAVVPGQLPSQWLMEAIAAKQLDEPLVTSLAAALLQSDQVPVLADVSRLCVALSRPELGPLLALVLQAVDMGVLLARDPQDHNNSIEDLLLRSWRAIGDIADDEVRGELLTGLRRAGMSHVELSVLLERGSPAELRAWLPAIVEDGFPERVAEAVVAALTRGEAVRLVLLELLGEMPIAQKTLLYQELRANAQVSADSELMGMFFAPR